jgi:hypothetical protein
MSEMSALLSLLDHGQSAGVSEMLEMSELLSLLEGVNNT